MVWLSILILSVFPSTSSWAQEICPTPEQILVYYKKHDVQAICSEANTIHAEDYGQRQGWYPGYESYAASMDGSASSQKRSLYLQKEMINPYIEEMGGSEELDIEKRLEIFATGIQARGRAPTLQEVKEQISKYSTDFEQVELAKKFAPLVCLPLSCSQAMQRVIELMDVRSFHEGPIALIPAYYEVLTSQDYVGPLSYAAFTMKKKVDNPHRFQFIGSFDQDLIEAFIHFGHSRTRAKTMAINVLGIYGSRGVPVLPQLQLAQTLGEAPMISMAAIGMISVYVNALETMALERGQNYAWPQSLNTTCLYLRPYHFWLSAYLTKQLMLEGYAENDIFEAIHLLNSFYEKFAKVRTNQNFYHHLSSIEQSDQTDWAYMVETQKDLAFNDAGIFWALREQTFSVDWTLNSMFQSTLQHNHLQDDLKAKLLSNFMAEQIKKLTGLRFSDDLYFIWDLKTGAHNSLLGAELFLK